MADKNSENKDLLEFAQCVLGADVKSAARGSHDSVAFAVVPRGMEVQSLKPLFDEYRGAVPERKAGTANLSTLESFIAHVNRAKDEGSAIFAEMVAESSKLVLRAVYDYHPQGGASVPGRWMDRRAEFPAPLSEAWVRWQSIKDRALNQVQLAELIEERMVDLLPSSVVGEKTRSMMSAIEADIGEPSTMLKVSRGLSVHTDQKVTNVVNLTTGGMQLHFEESSETRDKSGSQVTVPGAFVLGIAVFRGGATYQIPVRLRYRRDSGKVLWTLSLFRADLVFEAAATEAIERVRAETAIPVFFGTAEAAPAV